MNMLSFLQSWLLTLPILIPMATGALCLLWQKNSQRQRKLSILASALLAVFALLLLAQVLSQPESMLVVQMGGWKAPFGISFVADGLSAIMVAITGIIALMVAIYASYSETRSEIEAHPLARELLITPLMEARGYHAIYHFLLAALCGAFLTGDLFNLYVWFEILLICSFVLLSLDSARFRLRGALSYVLLNLISSALFLLALGLLYGLTGALNMADLGVQVASLSAEAQQLSSIIAILFMLAFGMKAAVFPLFYWLPAAYHTPPPAIGALFAGLLTKVGVYALLRVFTLIFIQDSAYTHTLLLMLAALTIIVGVLAALVQNDVRKILGFHLIAQVGFMLLGLGLYSLLGLRATVFYFLEDIIIIANLYLLFGVLARARGSFQLEQLSGLYARYGWLSALFLLSALSIAGIPPLSGFWAKLLVLQAAMASSGMLRIVVVTVVIVGALLSLLSLARVWMVAFWRSPPHSTDTDIDTDKDSSIALNRQSFRLYLPIMLLSAMALFIGIYPEPFIRLAERTAEGLLEPQHYQSIVLQKDVTVQGDRALPDALQENSQTDLLENVQMDASENLNAQDNATVTSAEHSQAEIYRVEASHVKTAHTDNPLTGEEQHP